jgi:hypothetical protein
MKKENQIEKIRQEIKEALSSNSFIKVTVKVMSLHQGITGWKPITIGWKELVGI